MCQYQVSPVDFWRTTSERTIHIGRMSLESAPVKMEVKHHDEQYIAPWADAEPYVPPQNTQPMPPAQQKEDEGREESLTTLLNEEQRGELTLLIATSMAAMRKTINSSFDANVCKLSPNCVGCD